MFLLLLAESLCIDEEKGSVVLDKGVFTVTLWNVIDMSNCSKSNNVTMTMSVWEDNFTITFPFNMQNSASNVVKVTCDDADFSECSEAVKRYAENDEVRIEIKNASGLSIFLNSYLLRLIAMSTSAIIGIIIGSVVGAIALAGGIWWTVVYSKKKVAYRKFQKLDAQMEY